MDNNVIDNYNPSIGVPNGFRTKLTVELDKLNDYQELRFWCVYAFRCLPFFNVQFLQYTESSAYISVFFSKIYALYSDDDSLSSIGINVKLAEKLNEIMSRIIRDFKLNPHIEFRAFLMYLADDLYVKASLNTGVFVKPLRENLICYTPNHDERFRNILIDDAQNIYKNKPLQNTTSIYGKHWNNFINALNKLNCDFFADCLQRLFSNNFTVNIKDKECLSNVPIEMYYRPSSEVSSYIKSLLLGSTKLNEARLILLGDKGSGKTSLARRLINPNAKMPNIKESTPGVDISNFKLQEICDSVGDSENANVRVWDFAGHTITHAAHRCFLSERCVYIILCEGRKERVHSLDYWLELVRNYGENSKIFIVVNKHDQNIVKVDENRINRDFHENNCEFHYFSIKEDNNTYLLQFRDCIAHHIANEPAWSSSKISLEWFNIKEKLEKHFGNKGIDYISIDDYYKIADSVGVKDRDNALKALSTLGICLYYPQIDDLKTVVLDPEWISFGIYDIINWLGNTRKSYKISLDEFSNVFLKIANKYPPEKHTFLYRLMMHYELAYEERNNILVIPQCMDTDEPKTLPKFEGEYLQMRFEAKNMDGCQIPFPPDLMPRIIVKRCFEMQNQGSFAWRYGAVLQIVGANALIFQSGSVLNIKVSGKKASEFNYELYQTIENVIKNYESFQKNKPIFSVLPFLNDGERGEITPVTTINNVAKIEQESYINPQDNQILDMIKNASAYPQIILFNPIFNAQTNISNDMVINQYYNCNFELQGVINDILSQLPTSNSATETKKELTDLTTSLEINEKSQSPEKDAKKTGLWNKLKRVCKNISNAESALNTSLRGMKNGKILIKELAIAYNGLAPFLNLPPIDLSILPFLSDSITKTEAN